MSSIQAGIITIGIDPHPSTHTATALDENGKVLESLTIRHSSKGLEKLRCWAKGGVDPLWWLFRPFGAG
jgi:hypothetical protein